MLGYGTSIDGKPGTDTSQAIAKFLGQERKGNSLEGSALTEALKEVADKRFEDRRAEVRKPVIKTSLPIDSNEFIFVSEQHNLLLAGSCGKVHVFRLDNLRPIDHLVGRNCRSTVAYSEKHNSLFETYGDGVVTRDVETGLATDFYAASDFGSAGQGVLLPDESGLIVARSFAGPAGVEAVVSHLDLSGSRAFTPLFRHRQKLSLNSLSMTPDGHYALSVGTATDQPSQTIVYDMQTRKVVREYAAGQADFANSNDLVVLTFAQKDDNHRIEIRDVRSNKLVSSKIIPHLFNAEAYGQSGSEAHSLSFLDDDKTLAYATLNDTTGTIQAWDIGTGAVKDLLKLPLSWSSVLDIRPKMNRVLISAPSGVESHALNGGEEEASSKTKPSAAAFAELSPDKKTLAIVAGGGDYDVSNRLWIMDLESGSIRASITFDKKYGQVSEARFRGTAAELIVTTGQGQLLFVDAATGNITRDLDLKSGDRTYFVGFDVSRHGDLAAVTMNDDLIRLVDLDSGKIVQTMKPSDKNMAGNVLAFVDNDRRLLSGNFHLDAFDVASGRKLFSKELIKYTNGRTYYRMSVNHVAKADATGSAYWVGAYGIVAGGGFFKYSDGKIVASYGADHDNRTFRSGESKAATPLEDGWMAWTENGAVSVTEPEYQLWPIKEVYEAHAAEIVLVDTLADGRLLSVAKDGTVHINERKKEAPQIVTQLYEDGSWLTRTPAGFFAGTQPAARLLYVRDDYKDVHTIDSLYDTLYRPDLIVEAMRGDPSGKLREISGRVNLATLFAGGSPPSVQIVSPADGAQASADSIDVTAAIRNGEQGTGRIEWRVNGITLGLDRGLERVEAQSVAGATQITKRLWLEPGENLIEVVAYNRSDAIAADPASIKVEWPSSGTEDAPTLHVLAVGVNDYWDSRLQLTYAKPDADAVASAFREAGKGLYKSVEVTELVDGEVNNDSLEQTFADLSNKVRPRDVFVFFLAGHGKTVDGHYYFIPQNFRYSGEKSIVEQGVGQEKWQAWFSKIAARKSILLYDTCESGSLTQDGPLVRGLERVAALERLTRAMGRTILSAAQDEQPALEGYHGHGVFTFALLDALQRADTNNNNLIEITEFAGYVDAQVPEVSYQAFGVRQVPQMKIVGSNFSLAHQTALQAETGMAQVISKKPTHVVMKLSDIYQMPDAGHPLGQLAPGTLVTLLKKEQGWSLVAKDGVQLGFVNDDSLVPAQ
ncbi:caspase family protein [Methyloceanibacter sp.]|uniref:caspase family protein n=1 Tax=Methyloceanibacter sp. TaxID=1965321 RepID=UPI003D6D59C7